MKTTINILNSKTVLFFSILFLGFMITANAQDQDIPKDDMSDSGRPAGGKKAETKYAYKIIFNSDNNEARNENFYVVYGRKHDIKMEVQRKGLVGTRNGIFSDWGHTYIVGDWDNTSEKTGNDFHDGKREDIIFGFDSNVRHGVQEKMRLTDKGRLGIGTNDPLDKLHIKNGGLLLESGGIDIKGRGKQRKIKNDWPLVFQADSDNVGGDRVYIFEGQGDSQYVRFDTNKNKNTINGLTTFTNLTTFKNAHFNENVLFRKNIEIREGNIAFSNLAVPQKGLTVKLNNQDTSVFKIINHNNALTTLMANNKGKVAIGGGTTENALTVYGSVKADAFRTSAKSFPDYVFDENYKLKPLTEVEAYVNTNKHLPGMPSEKEVVANGLDLKEVSVISVEKIEELYLYTIQQQKLIDQQNKRIEVLERLVKNSVSKN